MRLHGILILLTLAAPARAPAQTQTIGGIVVDARDQPLVSARVTLIEGNRATTTDSRGQFRFDGVTGSTHTLRVAMIGYRSVTQTVRSGQTDLRVVLTEAVINLEEVVVTGTAAGIVEKRSLGNSVARLPVAQLTAVAPASDVRQILMNRAPGVVLQSAGGFVGQGSKIRIRGITSLSLTNEPLIYIDGVRLDNTARTGPTFTGRSYISRFNDINPGDIESIEIIKGPAAATLYGTEASNGVIQIITKRGAQGKAQVTTSMEQGANWIMDAEDRGSTGYVRLPNGTIDSLNFTKEATARGEPLFRSGHRQQYGLEVSGGQQGFDYYVSGKYERDEGPLVSNALDRFTGRANLKILVNEHLDLTTTTSYVNTYLLPGETFERVSGFYFPDPRTRNDPRQGQPFAPTASYAFEKQWQALKRFSAGITANHRPRSWFTQRLSVGIDNVNEEDTGLIERLPDDQIQWFGSAAAGIKAVGKRDASYTTADYSGTVKLNLRSSLVSNTSLGAQYYRRFTKFLNTSGERFPAPGVRTIASAAVNRGTDDYIENATIGLYVQQQFAWRDRLYVTAALRGDDNSAFGRDFDFVTYPKFSVSWVASEERFWPFHFANTFRLRAAYGRSGQQPDAFAALQTYQPITGPGGTAAVRPQFVGNPQLGPERGEEFELGFEAALFKDRLGIDFTFYDKRTLDAILARPSAPSEGFPGLQFVNIGEIKNSGLEVTVDANPVTAGTFRWDLHGNLALNNNKILDLGGLPSIGLGVIQQHRKGFPVAALYDQFLVSVSTDANGGPINPMCDGGVDSNGDGTPDIRGGSPVPCGAAPPLFIGRITPKWEGAVNTTVTLGGRLSLYAQVDFKYGHHLFDANTLVMCSIFALCISNADRARDPFLTAVYEGTYWGSAGVWSAGFAKLRQVSASYQLPPRWSRFFGATSGTVTLSARNLHTWTSWPHPAKEPEVWELHPTGGEHYNQQQAQIPQPAQFIAAIRLTF